jgi:putative sterol carrier protein
MVQRISSCEEYFATLYDRFIPEQAAGVTATFVYNLDGEGGGQWTVKVTDGALSVAPGACLDPTVTYQMKADQYVRLANGDLNGTQAFLTRKLKVSGSLPMAQRMNKFLPPRA